MNNILVKCHRSNLFSGWGKKLAKYMAGEYVVASACSQVATIYVIYACY